MALLTRPAQTKIFGSTALASELTIFGSATLSTDIDLILNSTEAQRGWGTVGANDFPPLEWFNALGYGLSYQTAYLFQQGIPQWTALQEYYINSICVGSDGKIYRSLSGTGGTPNSGNNPTADAINWVHIFANYAPLASPALTGNVSINGVNVGVYPYRNRIINGAMNVNQIYGTTAVTPTTSAFISDQYYASSSQASKLTFQQVVDAPSGFKYSTKITVASQYAPLSTDSFALYQKIEGQNIIDFKFGTAGAVTINTSLSIKGSVAGTYSVSIKNGSSDRSYIGTITVGTSWSKVAINLVGANDGTWATDNTAGLILSIDLGSGSNFNTTAGAWQVGNFLRTSDSVTFVNQVAGSTLNITGVQLEKVPTGATQGTDYEWLPIEEEERRCARYLPVWNIIGTTHPISSAMCITTTNAAADLILQVPTRVPVTGVTVSASSSFSVWASNSAPIACTAVNIYFSSKTVITAAITVASGLVAGNATRFLGSTNGAKLYGTGAQL